MTEQRGDPDTPTRQAVGTAAPPSNVCPGTGDPHRYEPVRRQGGRGYSYICVDCLDRKRYFA